MDVLLLSRLLKELIIDNDRIPLPGMGYFQTEPMPAYFSEDGKTIYPPSKRISFKGDERAAGDLVARYYAAGTGMDGKTAATELEAFLQQLKVTLQERKNIEFPGLGRLRSTLEGNVYFVAEKDGGIFAQAFGFEPVTLKPVKTAPSCNGTYSDSSRITRRNGKARSDGNRSETCGTHVHRREERPPHPFHHPGHPGRPDHRRRHPGGTRPQRQARPPHLLRRGT